MAKQKSNLFSFGVIPGAACVTGFLLASILAIIVLQSKVDANHQDILAKSIASELAQQVNIKESQIKAQLSRIAESSLVTDVVGTPTAKVLEVEGLLIRIIPGAVRVKIIDIGEAKIDQGYPPFNFIAKDLVREVESGNEPPAEAISSSGQLEGEKWIVFATPIRSLDKTIRGTLFVYLTAKSLSDQITDGTKGDLSILQQRVGATPKPITMTGSGGTGPVYNHALNNRNWSISYRPAPDIASSHPTTVLLYFAPGIVMLVLCIGGAVLGAARTSTQLQTNLTQLGRQITGLATGTYEEQVNYTLVGFLDQARKLEQLTKLKPSKLQSAPVIGSKPPSLTPTDDDPVDMEIVDLDTYDEAEAATSAEIKGCTEQPLSFDLAAIRHIFRAYDIRGVVGEFLNEEIATQIGLAVGSEAIARGEQSVLVGYDGRTSSPELARAVMDGLMRSGRDVINIGSVPTPVLYYATHHSGAGSGIMVTGSHNAPDYNGFKVVLGRNSLNDREIESLYLRIKDKDFTSGDGRLIETDMLQAYLDAIADDIVVAQPLKVVVDCGNGIAGLIAAEMLDSLGCEAVPLYCEVDGTFPNHHPDPTKPENLEDLILTVQSQQADIGIALDGDGDRLVAVTAEGEIVWPDRLLMLFAKDVVSRNPGSDVIYDVKCTRHLNSVISGFGGRPIISRSGHSFIKEKIRETGAMLGGELSGHICFSERWFGFDDGLYAAARLLEIVGSQEAGLTQLMQEFPVSVTTPEIHISVDDDMKFELVDAFVARADFEDATVTTIDGLRVDFPDGWGLVRASNTEPALTLRFEADDENTLEDIKGAFRELMQEVHKDLDFS